MKTKKKEEDLFIDASSKPLVEWALESFFHHDVDRFLLYCRNEEGRSDCSYVSQSEFQELRKGFGQKNY